MSADRVQYQLPRRFRKRPVVIEAMQWDGGEESQRTIVNWAEGKVSGWFDNDGYYLEANTLEGPLAARPGDWIIKGVAGEFYPCKPDIFEATYEAVDSGGEGDL